ncbi:MAG TPA: hypothetical protein VJQ45_01175 [Ktedonobacterales bacterium]|nr:hypothetical protein [Ktedonobacterales bacterium]
MPPPNWGRPGIWLTGGARRAGCTLGPPIVAAVFFSASADINADRYHPAFAVLLVPALLSLDELIVA